MQVTAQAVFYRQLTSLASKAVLHVIGAEYPTDVGIAEMMARPGGS